MIRSARPEDAEQLGIVAVAAFFSAFRGVVDDAYLDLDWTGEKSAKSWTRYFGEAGQQSRHFHVFDDGGAIRGFALGTLEATTVGYDCGVTSLQVHPESQRRGIGRRLIAHSATQFLLEGRRALEIGCARENPSCEFYRRIGGLEIGERPTRIDRLETVELLFGWKSLEALANLAPSGP